MQADDVKLLGDDTYSLAISPNGKYVVGYNPSKIRSGVGTESFVYNVGSGALKWITTDSSDDWKTCGMFRDVNDFGNAMWVGKRFRTLYRFLTEQPLLPT